MRRLMRNAPRFPLGAKADRKARDGLTDPVPEISTGHHIKPQENHRKEVDPYATKAPAP
jgi:hypothetical protein